MLRLPAQRLANEDVLIISVCSEIPGLRIDGADPGSDQIHQLSWLH